MTSPLRNPQPNEWLRAYAQVQVVTDQQVLQILADATDQIRKDMLRITTKGKLGIGDRVRYDQMSTVRKALLEQQAEVLRALGRVVEARRLDAAARAINLGNAMDAYVLDRLGRTDLAREVLDNLAFGLAQTTDVALARMGLSYTDLSQRIYNNDVWLGGRIDSKITQALARGLTAREFAREAVDWFNPSTPGGVRYAAMRLARSEINNAYHAVAVQQVQDKPWVHAMKWYLSGSHPKADVCDEYANEDKFKLGAGLFPKADVPRKPHPHCYCYVAGAPIDEDEFLDSLVNGDYDRWIEKERALAESKRPVVPTPRSVAGGTRDRSAPPKQAPRPTPATRGGFAGQARPAGQASPAGLTPTVVEAGIRMYGDFTKNVALLDGMRVPDLKALAKHYGLAGSASQTRPVLLRRLKGKLSKGSS